jgi:hypothetical protein
LLPEGLLCIASRDGHLARAVPRYLTERDEVWIRAVLDAFDAYVGRTVGEREEALPDRVRTLAREHGVSTRAADGVAHVLRRRFTANVASRIAPARVRAIVFAEAARNVGFDRNASLRRASELLELTEAEVEASLFADRPAAKRIASPSAAPSPLEIVESYNLALVQGLLLRSERVVVEIREHVRAVVRFAKLAGLLCTCTLGDRGSRLEVSGPLSILRHTTRYGFALASFFPSVVSTPGFTLEARCNLRGEPVVVHIDSTDRIARTHKLPRDADSTIERALARDVRKLSADPARVAALGGPWALERESDAVQLGGRVFFPDFTLRHASGARVLVEIVGFYTPEYLRGKLVALRAAAAHPMIVCIDESLACEDGDVPGVVMRFKKRVDAAALLRRAAQLIPFGELDARHPEHAPRS